MKSVWSLQRCTLGPETQVEAGYLIIHRTLRFLGTGVLDQKTPLLKAGIDDLTDEENRA